ncbi:hypothetical protein EHZ19_10680 [Paraburkholderia bannensis]|nr:hypothetical protein [Paraburkholderia bannensis]RQM48661.1 hypothetical protein EHZ19_10680 [Paraburkholderia bannensis]
MSINDNRAMELAAQVVAAAATAGNLKLSGVPIGSASDAKSNGELDGAYVAALLKTIADNIKTV